MDLCGRVREPANLGAAPCLGEHDVYGIRLGAHHSAVCYFLDDRGNTTSVSNRGCHAQDRRAIVASAGMQLKVRVCKQFASVITLVHPAPRDVACFSLRTSTHHHRFTQLTVLNCLRIYAHENDVPRATVCRVGDDW
jgi:hypothetical protein